MIDCSVSFSILWYHNEWRLLSQMEYRGRVLRCVARRKFREYSNAMEYRDEFIKAASKKKARLSEEVVSSKQWQAVSKKSPLGRFADNRLVGTVDGTVLEDYYEVERERARVDGTTLVRMHYRRLPSTY